MKDKLPVLDENVGLIEGHLSRLEEEADRLRRQEQALTTQIERALESGEQDLESELASRRDAIRASGRRTDEQLEVTRGACERARQIKERYLSAIETLVQEVAAASRDRQRTQWQDRVTNLIERGPTGDARVSAEDMVTEVEEAAALAEARLEVALGDANAPVSRDVTGGRKNRDFLLREFRQVRSARERDDMAADSVGGGDVSEEGQDGDGGFRTE